MIPEGNKQKRQNHFWRRANHSLGCILQLENLSRMKIHFVVTYIVLPIPINLLVVYFPLSN
jgi:hypothetical protein